MKKRIISLLLALIMALSLLPVSVLAVESSAEPTVSADLPAEVALQPGDNFTLTVTALGSGTLSYQWYANTVSDYAGGTKIKGAESATYDVATAVEQEILHQLTELAAGRFSQTELETARMGLLSDLRLLCDSPGRLDEFHTGRAAEGAAQSPSELAAAIRAVTAEEVCAAARQVSPASRPWR